MLPKGNRSRTLFGQKIPQPLKCKINSPFQVNTVIQVICTAPWEQRFPQEGAPDIIPIKFTELGRAL